MRLLVCAVRDSMVEAFTTPMFFRSKGEAFRSFLDAFGSSDHVFTKHPDHYALWHLATFDDSSGSFQALEDMKPALILDGAGAVEILERDRPARSAS